MCGIAGYKVQSGVDFNNEGVIERMTSKLSHRGPDAHNCFKGNNTFLGHQRLSIIDLSEEANQPMHSNSGDLVIVFNGEIYNYKELIDKHQLNCRTKCDTEMILELYEKIGPDLFNELNGMFALCIYNKQRDEILIARDRVGIKPLYYYHQDGVFAFASELKSLLNCEQIKSKLELDKDALRTFLHLGFIQEPNSAFKQIKKFPSGSFAILKNGELSKSRYWYPGSKIEMDTQKDEKVAQEQLKELLFSSVEYRMIADVPLGTFLSGGIDSSTVTAIASQIKDEPVKTFSIGFKEAKYNEAAFAKEVANHLKTDHTEYFFSSQEAKDLLLTSIDQFDEPFADSSCLPTMLVSSLARKKVTVALSGDGGDEQFLGYGSYNWAKRLSNPIVSALSNPISKVLSLGDQRSKRAAHLFRTHKNTLSHIFSQEQYLFSQKEVEKITNSELNLEFPLMDHIGRPLSAVEQQAFFDLNYYLKDDLLVKVDRASMFHSLEVRVPLLDHRIIEFTLNLDESLKTKNGDSKYLLKKVLYELVPEKMFQRPKWGFSIPLKEWLKEDLSHLIEEHLSEDKIERTGFLMYSEVEKLLQKYRNGQDFLYNRVWALIVLQRFLLRYL